MSERREPLDAYLLLVQRFPELTEEQIMVIAGIPREEIRHTRAVQDWYLWGVLLRGYREFEQRIDALAERRQNQALAVPRAWKRQLVREACLRQLVPFPVSSIEQECSALASAAN